MTSAEQRLLPGCHPGGCRVRFISAPPKEELQGDSVPTQACLSSPVVDSLERIAPSGKSPPSAEPLREALSPAAEVRLPAKLALGLCVRKSPHFGHHHGCHFAGCEPSQPAWDAPGGLGAEGAGKDGQPFPYRRGLVVDDVVYARVAVIDRSGCRDRGIVDVDV